MARRSSPNAQPDQPLPTPHPGYPQQQYAPQPGYPPPPPPGYVPPGYELKRKKRFYKRVWFWLLVIVVLIIVIVVVAVSSAVHDATSKPHTVVYTVNGTGKISKADISYYTSDGSNHSSNVSAGKQPLPWTKSVTVKGDLSGFVLTANTPITLKTPKGTLSCTLSVDGKIVSTDKARGGADLVSCLGSGYDGK
jgi:hypothetical protein